MFLHASGVQCLDIFIPLLPPLLAFILTLPQACLTVPCQALILPKIHGVFASLSHLTIPSPQTRGSSALASSQRACIMEPSFKSIIYVRGVCY